MEGVRYYSVVDEAAPITTNTIMATPAAIRTRATIVALDADELSAEGTGENKDKHAVNSNIDNRDTNDDDDSGSNEGIPPLGIYTRAMGKLMPQNAAGATAVYQIFQMLGPMIFTPQPCDEENDE
jgi:hypothetical protein